MYLKQLDMVGFKSFADKTRLEFEPGMTAIVGPNGCGKSNISDALRWVLGEQSAKALRGARMEDCIFNGTDNRKPLGLADVSVTFADCEGVLNTEFNEVTVARRVFRSGEGQYFINKTPCRLKDIQRLFMDTGIGTSSYSMLEQGRIDAILSARPEDRREIFEEASGITKFKADKKEAIRKLEHTEANLLRLSDVIREVKRQIGSLQRQAGKARRYKALQEELRRVDVYVTRERLGAAAQELAAVEARLADLTAQLDTLQQAVREADKSNAGEREALLAAEQAMAGVLEAGVQARSKLAHTRELIELNRQRIEEYRALRDRDSQEVDQTARQLDELKRLLETQSTQADEARQEKTHAEQAWRTALQRFDEHRAQVERLRTTIQALREESVEHESLTSRLQNQLIELEARERSTIVQRERHAAEKAQFGRVVESFAARKQQLDQELANLQQRVAAEADAMAALEARRQAGQAEWEAARTAVAQLDREAAAQQARLDLLQEGETAAEGFAEGARRLLREGAKLGIESGAVVGTLAAALDVPAEYRLALETALRAWLDAVIVRDPAAARDVAERLSAGKLGAARLLALQPGAAPAAPARGKGERLLARIACPAELQPVLERLIGHVRVVDTLADIPSPVPADQAFVTRTGILIGGNGTADVWLPEGDVANPLARRRALAEGRDEQARLAARATEARRTVETAAAAVDATAKAIQAQRLKWDESRRALAQKEGESQIVAREAREAKQRFETVSWELEELAKRDHSGLKERQDIGTRIEKLQEQRRQLTADIAAHAQTLRTLEDQQLALQTAVTEHRVSHEGHSQRAQHLVAQRESTLSRTRDLEAALAGRARGIQTYADNMQKLADTNAAAEGQLAGMEAAVTANRTEAERMQADRERLADRIRGLEAALADQRTRLEEVREARSAAEIQLTEGRMRRQNQLDRVTADYGLTAEQLGLEPAPEWPEGTPPAMEVLDTSVAELRTKLEAMGPVNLVAIEEYQELEERHTFLTTQEQDLINAKQQLMEMIRKINRTTSEMFSTTFARVNENFQQTFQKLFNGGSAKLVLVNEEDVLECGIEIIARPPGKRLQNVSLMSGGERTMTAVALLFAIYMIKPSPFCVLDELDAALDESNIGRFVSMLQGFLNQSQFVIVTHNRQTISAADILYGVTMPEKGISKIVSMRFRGRDVPAQPQPAGATQAETPVDAN